MDDIEISWQDIEDIAIELEEAHPGVDVVNIRFTELLDYILALPGFIGKREECNEAKLEAIQQAWLEER